MLTINNLMMVMTLNQHWWDWCRGSRRVNADKTPGLKEKEILGYWVVWGSLSACLGCMWQGIKSQPGSGIFFLPWKVLNTCFWLPVFTGLAFLQAYNWIAINKWHTADFRWPVNARVIHTCDCPHTWATLLFLYMHSHSMLTHHNLLLWSTRSINSARLNALSQLLDGHILKSHVQIDHLHSQAIKNRL